MYIGSSMAPTLTNLDFETIDPSQFVHIVSNLLGEEECASIIKSHTDLEDQSGWPVGTIRSREVFEDPDLVSLLWSRLSQFYVGDRIKDEDGYWWRVKGLNPMLRLSKYEKGGKFAPHFDYPRLASINEQSFMSVNIYLKTVPLENKGATRILHHVPGMPLYWNGSDRLHVLAKIQPVLGSASIFRETLWHDGEELLGGEKYLLRTDVIYEREGGFDFEATYGKLSAKEQRIKALEIASRLEDGGNSEDARWWYWRASDLEATA